MAFIPGNRRSPVETGREPIRRGGIADVEVANVKLSAPKNIKVG